MKTRLEKHRVCVNCHGIGIVNADCICTYNNKYEIIELEFEVCDCCGNVLEDGQIADTEFNKNQLKNN